MQKKNATLLALHQAGLEPIICCIEHELLTLKPPKRTTVLISLLRSSQCL